MKKVFIIMLSLLITSTCYAQDEADMNSQTQLEEIDLQTTYTQKRYNLTKPDCNKIEKNFDEDDEEIVIPFNMMQPQLNMLKQFQQY